MNKLVIAVAAVSSAFIPVAQAADYTYQSGDPKEASSWKDATDETPEAAPGETDGVVFGAAGTADTFPVKSDLIYSKFTAKNEIGDTTIDLTSDSAAVTNTLTVSGDFTVNDKTLTVKNGKVNLSGNKGAKAVSEDTWIIWDNVHFVGWRLTEENGKGNVLVKNGSFIESLSGNGCVFKGGDLVFDGKETVYRREGGLQMRAAKQKLIVRNGACLDFKSSDINLSGWSADNKAIGNELHLADGGFISSMRHINASLQVSYIYVTNTTTSLPKITLGTNSLVRISDATVSPFNRSPNNNTWTVEKNSLFVVERATLTDVPEDFKFKGANAVFEVKNGSQVRAFSFELNGDGAGCRVSGRSVLTVGNSPTFDGNGGIKLNDAFNVFLDIDDSTVTNYAKTVQSKGTVALSGKRPKAFYNSDYTLNNDAATDATAYPTLKFTLPDAEADVWTEAPFEVNKTATIGANAVIVVEVPKTLKKKMTVPLLTAKNGLSLGEGVLAIADLPEGATLAVGNYDETTEKWVAAENGKTLFFNFPSRVGFTLIVR